MYENNETSSTKKTNLNETELEYRLVISIEDESNLDKLHSEIVDFLRAQSAEYIWNNERFDLSPKKPSKTHIEPYFACEGRLDYGDNLEDEWFVVYLLLTLTRKFSGQVSAQICDIDGEFLLIHCANYLPDFASSAADDQMTNRVHLFDGELHIIPPASTPAQITYLPGHGKINQPIDAANIVFNFPHLTKSTNQIQTFLNKKLLTLSNPKTYLHKQTLTLPSNLVWLLRNNASLISHAVNRFCDKDPLDLKQCRNLKHFKPANLIEYQVKFTKHLYGKLKCCEYKADKRHEWPVFGSNVSPSAKNKLKSLLGFKLTCAFEVLVNRVISNKSESFDAFLEKLKNLGFFNGCLENSKKYLELVKMAEKNWSDMNKNVDDKSGKESLSSDLLLKSVYNGDLPDEVSIEKLKEELKKEGCNEDDSDEWLCVEPPQLDDYLDMYSRGEVSSVYDFKLVSDAFKQFIEEEPAKNEDLLSGVKYESIDKNDENLVDFDVECIEKNLRELLGEEMMTNKKEEAINEDDENDSFYEVDEDLLDEDENKEMTELNDYMKSMDEELSDLKELSRLDTKSEPANADELNIDLNLVSNALESYSSQMGLTGPVSNILKSLGI